MSVGNGNGNSLIVESCLNSSDQNAGFTYDVETETWVPVSPLTMPQCSLSILRDATGQILRKRGAVLLWCSTHNEVFWARFDTEESGD